LCALVEEDLLTIVDGFISEASEVHGDLPDKLDCIEMAVLQVFVE
jgi:hypothetical protein